MEGGGGDGDCEVELYNYSIYLKNLNIFLKSCLYNIILFCEPWNQSSNFKKAFCVKNNILNLFPKFFFYLKLVISSQNKILFDIGVPRHAPLVAVWCGV